MANLHVPKRIHIIPLGYEKDRIIEPLISYDADEALLLEPDPNADEFDQPEYHDRVRERIESEGISS